MGIFAVFVMKENLSTTLGKTSDSVLGGQNKDDESSVRGSIQD